MIVAAFLLLQAGHVFQPVDRSWRLIEDTMTRHPETFVVVKPKERSPKALYWREKRYSEERQERKILRYDPQGRLRMEADLFDGEQFTRLLRADGSLSAYHHHRNLRMVEGYSVSPDGKTLYHVQDGLGELVTEGEDGAWNHLRLLPGITVAKDYRGSQRCRISIWIGNDHYVRTPDTEELSLDAPAERWTVRGQKVDLDFMDFELVDGKVRQRAREANPDVRRMPVWHSDIPQGILEEWAAAWPKRRAAFIERVDDALNAAEEEWGRLELDFIRDGTSWRK